MEKTTRYIHIHALALALGEGRVHPPCIRVFGWGWAILYARDLAQIRQTTRSNKIKYVTNDGMGVRGRPTWRGLDLRLARTSFL